MEDKFGKETFSEGSGFGAVVRVVRDDQLAEILTLVLL